MILKYTKDIFVYLSTHTYSNLSRLFLRMFVGVVILQLGVNQMTHFDELSSFSGVMGMSGATTIGVMIAVELVCSTLIILGLLTRFAIVPPALLMVLAAYLVMNETASVSGDVFGMQPVMLPVMFVGIFVFLFISGPGKISLDYILARYIISYAETTEEEEKTLEEA